MKPAAARLADLTWQEAEQVLTNDAVIMIPLGMLSQLPPDQVG